MSEYGVQPTGFVRKPLSVIKAEIEAQLITEFGPEVIQTSQSPLGQLNGMMSNLIAQLWEVAEDVYQSYDPDQAEGIRLDTLARLRLLSRGGAGDTDFRESITNEGTARITITDLAQAVAGVEGVTYSQVFVNETSEIDSNRMPPNTVAVAALGGQDEEVAAVVNRFIPVGISTHGNLPVQTIEDGYCRTVRLVRPEVMPVRLTVQILTNVGTRRNCPSPSPSAIGLALADHMAASSTRPINGQAIDAYYLRTFLEGSFDGVQYVNHFGYKGDEEFPYYSSIPMDFFEIAEIESIDIEVV